MRSTCGSTSVLNCTGMVITANHKADGLYFPADDRRHYVAWTELAKEDFPADYFPKLWACTAPAAWVSDRGLSANPRYLRVHQRPRRPRRGHSGRLSRQTMHPRTATSRRCWTLPAIRTLSRSTSCWAAANAEFGEYLRDRKNRRQIPYRFEECEYLPVRNGAAKDGLWKIRGKRCVVYAKRELSLRDQIKAASNLTGG